MNRFILFILMSLLLSSSFAIAKGPIRTIEGTVTKVSDGDTINVTDTLGTKLKVRLYGIDAPETEKSNKKTGRISKQGQSYGENAQRALEEMVFRKPVRLEVMAIDKYKRTVAIVWTVDKIVNKEMVKYGWAWAYRQYLDRPYASEYIDLEEQARKESRGLWEKSNPQPPWEFRKLQSNSRKQRI